MFSGTHFHLSSTLLRRSCRFLRQSSLKYSENGQDGKNDANQKLNSLLQSIIKEGQVMEKSSPKVMVPRARVGGRRLADQQERKPEQSLGKQLVDAAQKLAEKTPSNKDKTEAELLHKLLYKETPLAKDIAKHSKSKEKLAQLMSTMKIERAEESLPQKHDGFLSRSDQIRTVVPKPSYSKFKSKMPFKKIELFRAESLGIFSEVSDKTKYFKKEDHISLQTWQACEERELQLAVEHPPASYYEQMIHWTNKGVVWKFPIDNEQGMDDEKKISFADHVFLEVHLEDWCPETGPVRHFMELVCVGLSRNHWLTADEKKEYILWYREYFLDKKNLLKEVGAGQISEEQPSLTA